MTRDRGFGPVPEGLEKLDPDGWLNQVRRFLLDLKGGRIEGVGAGGTTTVVTTAPGPAVPGPPGAPAPDYTPDLTPPPTPGSFTAVAGLDFVGLSTEAPTFTQGHGYGRTIVYGAKYSGIGPLPTFGAAVIVHEFVGEVGTFPSEPKTQWHLWAKWKTRDGELSISPAGGTNGVQVTTGNDVTKLLEALSGQITQSQLYSALGARINLIDDPDTVPGSVAARIKTETTRATTAESSLSSTLTTVSATASGAASAVATLTTTVANGDSTNAAAITTLQSRVEGAGANVVKNGSFEVDSNADGLADFWSVFVGGVGDPSRVHDVSRVAALNGNGFAQRVRIASSSTAADSVLANSSSTFPLKPNTKYTVSLAVRTNTFGTYALVRTYTAGSALVADFPTPTVAVVTAVGRLKVTFTTGPTVALGEVQIRGITTAGHFFEADTVKVQEGEIATPYVPGDDDLGTLYSAVQTEVSTRASQTGYLGAQWTLRMTVGNIVGGVGLAGSSAPGAQPTIDFGIRANKFFIAAPEGIGGISNIVPFAVQTVPTTTPAGEVLPAGVYMDAAYIRNLEVVLGRFNQAIITNAMIVSLDVSKLRAGSIAVGEYIQSSGYTVGGAGFRIDGGGNVDIANTGRTRVFNLGASGTQPVLKVGGAFEILANGTASYAGQVTANSGVIGGHTINSTGIQSPDYVPGVSGTRLASSGVSQIPAAAIIGKLSAGNIVGSTQNSFNVSSPNLASGGRVLNQSYFQALEFALESAPLQAATIGLNGWFNITLGASVPSPNIYKLNIDYPLTLEAWDGSSWVVMSFAQGFMSVSVYLANNEVYAFPFSAEVGQSAMPSIYTKVRARLTISATFNQLAVNGGAAKLDAMSVFFVQGSMSMRQTPN